MLIKIRGRGIREGARHRLPEYPGGIERPKTRGECEGGERPCPFVSCRHNMFLTITQIGNIKTHANEIEDLRESCALDVADEGPHSLQETADIMGIVRERVRQLESQGLKKLRKKTDHAVTTKDFETRSREYDPRQCAISLKLNSWSAPLSKQRRDPSG